MESGTGLLEKDAMRIAQAGGLDKRSRRRQRTFAAERAILLDLSADPLQDDEAERVPFVFCLGR